MNEYSKKRLVKPENDREPRFKDVDLIRYDKDLNYKKYSTYFCAVCGADCHVMSAMDHVYKAKYLSSGTSTRTTFYWFCSETHKEFFKENPEKVRQAVRESHRRMKERNSNG